MNSAETIHAIYPCSLMQFLSLTAPALGGQEVQERPSLSHPSAPQSNGQSVGQAKAPLNTLRSSILISHNFTGRFPGSSKNAIATVADATSVLVRYSSAQTVGSNRTSLDPSHRNFREKLQHGETALEAAERMKKLPGT